MSTLILAAPGALTAPLPNTPTIPDLARGLLLSFDANKMGYNDADPVISWKNAGGSWGSLADLTQASTKRPVFAKSGISTGNSSVRFSLANATFLRTSSGQAITPRVNTPISVSVLVKFTSDPGSTVQNIFSGRTGAAGAYVYARRTASGTISIGAGGVDQLVSVATVPVGKWVVITCVFDGANSKVTVDKAQLKGTTASAYWDGIVLGANGSEVNNMDGELAAMKAYSRALSDSEIILIRDDLLAAHGLAA